MAYVAILCQRDDAVLLATLRHLMTSAWQSNVLLAPRTTLGLGGPARRLIELQNGDDVSEIVCALRAENEPFVVLGGGSNLVVSDAGYNGSVLAMATRGVDVSWHGEHALVTVRAGERWDDFVAAMVDAKLAGLECLSGIPGLAGATPIQNVGAYGQEVSDTIETVRVLDVESLEEKWMRSSECAFAYRDSMFKRAPQQYIVLDVVFRLRRAAPVVPPYAELTRALASKSSPTLREVRDTVIALRKTKGMVLDAHDPDSRSAGSFFLNPIVPDADAAQIETRARALGVLAIDEKMPVFTAKSGFSKVPAAWLIERAGIHKGMRRGAVGVSSKHTLALVHHGGGTANELLALAAEIRETVHAKFGVTLEQEPVIL